MDEFEKLPAWQLAAIWIVVAVLIGVGWYFFYYSDTQDKIAQSQIALKKAETDLADMKKKVENFEEEMSKAAAAEKEIEKAKQILPLSASTVDHLMRKFQQQGRLVGVDLQNWRPGAEKKMDFYAQMPVQITAEGSWHQAGEFFRRVSELEQIVNIEEVKLKADRGTKPGEATTLAIEFKASTFRFLDPSERAGGNEQRRRR